MGWIWGLFSGSLKLMFSILVSSHMGGLGGKIVISRGGKVEHPKNSVGIIVLKTAGLQFIGGNLLFAGSSSELFVRSTCSNGSVAKGFATGAVGGLGTGSWVSSPLSRD